MGTANSGLGQTNPNIDITNALVKNTKFAQTLGWQAHLDRIYNMLGFGNFCPTDYAFAYAVARWQQQNKNGWKLSIDGIIGPGTWNAMRCLLGLGSYSTVDTLLPERGSGFYSYASPSYQFGHSKVVEALKSIANAWNDKHLAGPLIGIGEISCNQGGSMVPKHGSHRFGVDVDIRPFRKDGKREPVTHWDDEYSLELTKEFVNLTRNNGFLRVERIFFNDSKINGVEKAEGHDNHLHIRFISPSMAP